MRLGFDLDGVLADLQGRLDREARRLFGELPPQPVGRPPRPIAGRELETPAGEPERPALASLTAAQQNLLWQEMAGVENFWETLDETEAGSVERLSRIVSARRWEIIFLTSRPDIGGEAVQRQSQRWLEGRGFPLPAVFVVNGSRGKIADALQLDVVVDDRPENCLDVVVDSKAKAILVWHGEEAIAANARRLGIGTVKTVSACLDVLDGVGGSGQRGTLGRLKRLLGLGDPSPLGELA
jgi:hypothetical protein